MNGYMLLHMDISLFGIKLDSVMVVLYCLFVVCLFAAELGIDNNEIREIFLAKIYELSNPSSSVGRMEDDFLRELVQTVLPV